MQNCLTYITAAQDLRLCVKDKDHAWSQSIGEVVITPAQVLQLYFHIMQPREAAGRAGVRLEACTGRAGQAEGRASPEGAASA